MSDRIKIHICKLCNRLRRFLIIAPEPSACDTGIRLRYRPLISIRKAYRRTIASCPVAVNRILFFVRL